MTAPKQRINVEIMPDGSILFKPVGYAGGKCKDVTRGLEKAMGDVKSVKRTAEWTTKEAEVEKAKQVRG